jgi:3-dehydroquinate dehydratase-2
MKICIINGPNLQLLGTREPDVYSKITLDDITAKIKNLAKNFKNVRVEFFQSNNEGEIVDKIGNLYKSGCDGIIINPAAYTHTSIAIYDALKAVNIPTIEVHISNIYKRESFRRHSITAGACIGQISGLGIKSYECAFSVLIDYINNNNENSEG